MKERNQHENFNHKTDNEMHSEINCHTCDKSKRNTDTNRILNGKRIHLYLTECFE